MVWDEEPLFRSSFEAWANGPVCRWNLYNEHRRSFAVASWPMGDASRLTRSEAETVDAVVDAYAHLNGQQLSRLTHAEEPWRGWHERSPVRVSEVNVGIKKSAMAEYYGSIDWRGMILSR